MTSSSNIAPAADRRGGGASPADQSADGPAGSRPALVCPSARPEMAQAQPLGVYFGSARAVRLTFLARPTAETLNWREYVAERHALRVFRFSARCDGAACAHGRGGRCGLGDQVMAKTVPVADAVSLCAIRDRCRWRIENGPAVCLRCPQVTDTAQGSPDFPTPNAGRGDAQPAAAGYRETHAVALGCTP